MAKLRKGLIVAFRFCITECKKHRPVAFLQGRSLTRLDGDLIMMMMTRMRMRMMMMMMMYHRVQEAPGGIPARAISDKPELCTQGLMEISERMMMMLMMSKGRSIIILKMK